MRRQSTGLFLPAAGMLLLVLPLPLGAQSFDGFVPEQAYEGNAFPPTLDGYIAPNAVEPRVRTRPQQAAPAPSAIEIQRTPPAEEVYRTPPVFEERAAHNTANHGYVSLASAMDVPEPEEEDNFDDEAEIAAAENGGGKSNCGTCSSYAGFEFVSLFPNGSEYVEIDFHTGLDNLPHFPFGAHPEGDAFDLTRPWGYRLWAGNENCCGQGTRITYWQWNDEANFGGFDFDADLDLESVSRTIDIWTVDIEGTQKMYYGNTEMLGSLGLRIADFEYAVAYNEDSLLLPLSHSGSQEFFGYGITAAFEGRRPLCWFPCWEGFAKLRGSLLFGNSDFAASGHNFNILDDIDINFDVAGQVKYQTFMVWETQIGVERQWCMNYGTLFVRAAFEAQMWEVPPTRGIGDLNLGLVGNAFAIGFTR